MTGQLREELLYFNFTGNGLIQYFTKNALIEDNELLKLN